MAYLNKPLTDKSVGVHELLRNATHKQHVKLNHHPMLISLMQPAYPLVRYLQLLNAYFYIYKIFEDKITSFLEAEICTFSYASRYKLPWLQQSLATFHESTLSLNDTPPMQITLPAIENLGQLIGVLYVIEGSTLGGQHIAKYLSNSFGYLGDDGVRFFEGYGEKTSSNWQEFLLFADSISHHPEYCAAAEHSAELTFEFFERVLDCYAQSEHGGVC